MTEFEKAFAKMTPAQRKKATAAVSGQMGMMDKPKKKTAKTTAKKRKK